MGLFIWSVQAHRCRNGSRSSSGGRASSPTAAGPVITSGSSFGASRCNSVPVHRDEAPQTRRFSPQKHAKGLSLYGAISTYPAAR